MLKNIPDIISPELMYVLMSMGHGDTIVLADGNFPAASIAEKMPGGLIRADGHGVPELLKALLKFFPLDTIHGDLKSIVLMDKPGRDKPAIWAAYKEVFKSNVAPVENRLQYEDESKGTYWCTPVKRDEFYKLAKNAFAVVATSEGALYANIILRMGVVK